MMEPARATEQLVERVRAGDTTAWDELVQEYTPLLWRVARSYPLSQEAAADAVQSTWLRLVEALTRIQAPALTGWLITTVRREAQRLAARSQVDAAPLPPALPADPEAIVVRRERDALLWRAMQQLPRRCQILLQVMLDPGSRPYHDIATALDMPVGSIGPTRARCLQRLRVLVETMSLRDDDVLTTEDSLVQALRNIPRILDTVPPEVVEGAARAREP
jgi:RNA polymerase sigma factor (sigma-70 family)